LLAALSDDDFAELCQCAKQTFFVKDQELLRQGQHSASLFVVQDGLLHVRRRVNDHDTLLGRLEPGGFFGEISLFDPGPTTASVRALSNGTLIEIGRRQLDRFVERRPEGGAKLLAALLEEVASRLRRTDQLLDDSILWGGLLRDKP
jgi:CRP/FNR family cyclic AMP-dependent transcriptional regulator